MSLWSKFLRTEQRLLDASQFPLGDELFPARSDAGVPVTKETATRLVAVLACQGIVSDSISTMPIDLYRRTDTGRVPVARPPAWLEFPNDEQHIQAFVENIMMELLSSGNAFVQIAARDSLLFPSELRVMPSEEFMVRRDGGPKRLFHIPSGRFVELFSPRNPGGEFLHIAGLSDNGLYGLSPIEKAQQEIGLGLATLKFGAKFFGNGAQLAGTIEMPPGSHPTDDQLKALSEMWRRKFSGVDKAWSVPVLANGAKFTPGQMPNEAAQFLETRRFTVGQIASLYRVPPHMIGDVERSTSWGSGIEEQGIGFVTYTLATWIRRLELALSQLTPRNQYVKWNVNSLLRGDVQSRYAAYQVGVNTGFMNRNEVRELEDMAPVAGLDEFFIPVSQAQPQETPA
jgi:HK97 family phage portal protein